MAQEIHRMQAHCRRPECRVAHPSHNSTSAWSRMTSMRSLRAPILLSLRVQQSGDLPGRSSRNAPVRSSSPDASLRKPPSNLPGKARTFFIRPNDCLATSPSGSELVQTLVATLTKCPHTPTLVLSLLYPYFCLDQATVGYLYTLNHTFS